MFEDATQLAQGIHLDLAHTFAGDAEFESDFFQGAARVIAQTEATHDDITLFCVELVEPAVEVFDDGFILQNA